MAVAEIITSILGGGLTGLLGSVFTSIMDYKKMGKQYEHEEEMARIETKHLQMEIERDVIVAKEEATARMEEAESRVQEASYDADERRYVPTSAVKKSKVVTLFMGIVDFLRGMIRPVVTIYVCGVVTWVALKVFEIWEASGGKLDQAQAFELVQLIVLGLLYLTFMVLGWWFGSRSKFKDIIVAKMQ